MISASQQSVGAPPIPTSTFSLFQRGAERFGESHALTIIHDANNPEKADRCSYTTLLEKMTQAANLFHVLGATSANVIAYVLPNLAQTYFALCCAEACSIALAISPALGAEAIARLLNATRAYILVTLALSKDNFLFHELAPILVGCPSLRHIVTVGKVSADMPHPAGITISDFEHGTAGQWQHRLRNGRKIAVDDQSSWFCTGGTTGLPKMARRTHGNEVTNAYSLQRHFGQYAAHANVTSASFRCFMSIASQYRHRYFWRNSFSLYWSI
jgi:fatty-acyl-CoA synthase